MDGQRRGRNRLLVVEAKRLVRVGADLLAVGADEAADIDGSRQQILTVRLERVHEAGHDPAPGRDGFHGEAGPLTASTQIRTQGVLGAHVLNFAS